MTAATTARYLGTMDDSPRQFPTATVAPKQGWLMGRYPIGTPNAGKVDPIGTDPTLQCVGVARFSVSTSAVPATAQEVYCDPGIVPLFATSVDETWEGQPIYGVDNQTVQLTDGGGQYPLVGVGWWAESTTVIHCKVGPMGMAEARAILAASASITSRRVRAVITAIGTYVAANGTITASAVNATLTKDGVTPSLGDELFLPPHLCAAASDAGPYVLITDTGVSAKFVLERPSWWLDGQTVPSGFIVEIGGEGTTYAGSEWKALPATNAKVIDTDDPGFWPRIQNWPAAQLASGTYTLGTGGGGEKIYLRATTRAIQATVNTHAGTLGTDKLEVPVASRVAGNVGGPVNGSAAVVINALNDNGSVSAETSTVDVSWINW